MKPIISPPVNRNMFQQSAASRDNRSLTPSAIDPRKCLHLPGAARQLCLAVS